MASKLFASKSIMIIGSSMTQRAYDLQHLGFGIGLSDWYSRLADIYLRGQSGYNSRWTLASLQDLIGPHKPDMAIIFLGNNDSLTGKNGQCVPVEEFRENMIAIMRTFRVVNPHIVFLLLTPTVATKIGRIDSVTEKYVHVVRELGSLDEHTAVVELWDGDNAVTKFDLCDTLHLNISGNNKVLCNIKAAIRLHFKEFVPFNDINPLNNHKENDKENVDKQHSLSDGGKIVKQKNSDKVRRLKWLFPPWNQLAGKSLEESVQVIHSARTRSFL
jgi:lysophospholipase L1-like esterase